MRELTLPAYPLITIDPLFSIWSTSKKLYDDETRHWTGAAKPINGNITIDGITKRFMGIKGSKNVIPQQNVKVGLTSTQYTFEDKQVRLRVKFTTPSLLADMAIATRPTSYIDIIAEPIDGKPHKIEVMVDFSEKLTYSGNKKLTKGGILPFEDARIGYLGRALQQPLSEAGDRKDIDWGWLYMSSKSKVFLSGNTAIKKYFNDEYAEDDTGYRKLLVSYADADLQPDQQLSYTIVVGYDDSYSLNYFGEYKRGYWKKFYTNIVEAIQHSFATHDQVMESCEAADTKLETEVLAKYGEGYLAILLAAYRQVMAAHKIIEDNDEAIMISKECASNGCAGTADVAYPSIPLFLLKKPELVKAMLIPLFQFSRMRVWTYDFAPHDVGVYPFVMGQVYGVKKQNVVKSKYDITKKYIFHCTGKKHLFKEDMQMPVEECGNMIIMTAAYFNMSGDFKFIRENADLLSKWADYLVKQGVVLPLQLSTDDFGGKLDKNVNLAIKSVVSIALWGKLLNEIQPGEGAKFLDTAKSYAKELELMSFIGDHTAQVIEDRQSWGLKYNLVWDKIFKLDLFSEELYKKEMEFYGYHFNKYGVPLDYRMQNTKSDWLIWVSTLDGSPATVEKYAYGIARMLKETSSNLPFTDYYNSLTGDAIMFRHRSVQGALWLPLLIDKINDPETNNFLL